MKTTTLTRTFWSYTLPAMAALMVSGLYAVVDGIFIGHALGAPGLSALNLAWPLAGLIWAVAMLVGMGGGAETGPRAAGRRQRAGRDPGRDPPSHGARGHRDRRRHPGLRRPIPGASGADAELAAMGLGYLSVQGWAAPAIMAGMAFPLLLRNLGAPGLTPWPCWPVRL